MRLWKACSLSAALVLSASSARATSWKNGFYVNTSLPNGFYVNTSTPNGFYVNTGVINGFTENTAAVNGSILGKRDDSITGYFLHAAALNPETVDGISLAAMTKDGQRIYGVRLRGSEITGYTWHPACPAKLDPSETCTFYYFVGQYMVTHRGAWFVGATIDGVAIPFHEQSIPVCSRTAKVDYPTAKGGPVEVGLKIVAMHQSDDIFSYDVALNDPARKDDARFICGTKVVTAASSLSTTVPVDAIPLAGTWNLFPDLQSDIDAGETPTGGAHVSASSNLITFACTNAALGECAKDLGYAPWRGAATSFCAPGQTCVWVQSDYPNLHQACTRMIRADYCGTGMPHTVTGTNIDVYDRLHINDPESYDVVHIDPYTGEPPPGWPTTYPWEALWGPQGAVMYTCDRYEPLFEPFEHRCPSLDAGIAICVSALDHYFPRLSSWDRTNTGLIANFHQPTCDPNDVLMNSTLISNIKK
jgi:hypothetical protein